MDFVRLGEAYSSTYLPDPIIEGYNSLIWTERFQEHGEFELKSFDLSLAEKLPEDTLVSHLETREVMIVETHEIAMVGEGADAIPEITIRGRSVPSILEGRWVESTYQKKRRMRRKYSATSALAVLLVNAVDNTSGKDITRGDDESETPEKNDYSWTTRDAIPNVAVTESVAAEGTSRWWPLEQGILYPQFQKILVDADLGIRGIRPVEPNPAVVLTVKSNLAERGVVTRTASSNVTGLQFNVYAGVNRTTGDGAVKFSLMQGHLENPIWLKSSRDFKTALEVMSGVVEVKDQYRPGESGYSGFRRKVMGFDAGSPELPDEPAKPREPRSNATKAQREQYRKDLDAWQDKWARWDNKRDRIVLEFREEQISAAQRELKKARRVNMFSGDVSALAPYVYKTDYDLGDRVLLFDGAGKSQEMIVSEFVRSEDTNGERGFPGLVLP